VGSLRAGAVTSIPGGKSAGNIIPGINIPAQGSLSLFLAGDANGNIATSPDAIHWTLENPDMPDGVGAFATNSIIFVAGGGNGKLSTRGKSAVWTPQSTPFSGDITSIAYGLGKFVAITDAGEIATSTDAVHWDATTISPPGTGGATLNTIVFANDKFTLVGTSSVTFFANSSDGVSWVASELPANEGDSGGVDVTWLAYNGHGVYMCAGIVSGADTPGNGNYWTSADGVTWVAQSVDSATNGWGQVQPNPPQLYATIAEEPSPKVVVSGDGINWSVTGTITSFNASTPGNFFLPVLTGRETVGDAIFVAGDSFGPNIATSPSTDPWVNTARTNPLTAGIGALLYGTIA
jgi:hypothetical protein